jgi:MFS transporter, NNP family, nitrate/nitrite transporter
MTDAAAPTILVPAKQTRAHRTGRWIDHWEPEDDGFWRATGRRVARRNLIFSIFAEHLGFSVWLLWSVVVVSLPAAGFAFSVDQLFWLVAVPNLVGSLLRFPYTFAVPRFGGRNWTVVSAVLLLVPTGLLAYAVTEPATPYWAFLFIAATAGLGGGNFASSMANISFFYPDRHKGLALGLNAAGGNIGVSLVQLLVPVVITVGVVGAAQRPDLYLQNAGLFFVPLIALSALGAWLFMDNLTTARSSFRDQAVIARRKQTWVMSILYIGTFGSFIGYSAAFPLLIKQEFAGVVVSHFAFLGPLVGSLSRPVGGRLSDRIGGARVTLWNFAAMGFGVVAVIFSVDAHSWAAFLASFLLLFVTAGVGNGSTFRMIPVIFREEALRDVDATDPQARATAMARGRREAAAVLGFSSAVGAFGGFLIPRGFGMSISQTGGLLPALLCFLAFYVVCLAGTWWYYLRRAPVGSRVPSLATANV